MNNSFLKDEEEVIDNSGVLYKRKTELTKIIESINSLSKNPNWQILKELVFGKVEERLEKSIQVEAKKNELQPAEIYRLQGQLLWAKRYSNIYKLAEAYKIELDNITKKLNENANNS